MMKIYTPLTESGDKRQFVLPEVREAIAAQIVPCEIVDVYGPGEMRSQRNFSPARILGEALARTRIVEAAITEASDYFLMADRDRFARPETAMNLYTAISADPTIGMVSAVETTHCRWVSIGFCICRLSAFRQIIPIVNKYGNCLCREVNEALEKIGFKSEYLSKTEQFTKEIL